MAKRWLRSGRAARIRLFSIPAIVLLVACAQEVPQIDPPIPVPEVIALSCGDYEIDVNLGTEGDALTAVIDDQISIEAEQVEAASGAQYRGEVLWSNDNEPAETWNLMLWNHGEDWMASINDGPDIECVVN